MDLGWVRHAQGIHVQSTAELDIGRHCIDDEDMD